MLTGSITLAKTNLFHNNPLLKRTWVLCSPAHSRVRCCAIITSAASDTKRHKITIAPVRSHPTHTPPCYCPSSPQTVVQSQRQPAQPLQNQETHHSLSCCTIICSHTLTRPTTASPSQTSCQHTALLLRGYVRHLQ